MEKSLLYVLVLKRKENIFLSFLTYFLEKSISLEKLFFTIIIIAQALFSLVFI